MNAKMRQKVYMVYTTESDSGYIIEGLFTSKAAARLYRQRREVLEPRETFDILVLPLWQVGPYPQLQPSTYGVRHTLDEAGAVPEPNMPNFDPPAPITLPPGDQSKPFGPPEKLLIPVIAMPLFNAFPRPKSEQTGVDPGYWDRLGETTAQAEPRGVLLP